jgi:hypothetical protein
MCSAAVAPLRMAVHVVRWMVVMVRRGERSETRTSVPSTKPASASERGPGPGPVQVLSVGLEQQTDKWAREVERLLGDVLRERKFGMHHEDRQ